MLPTGDIKIEDGNLSTDRENYKEFWYAMVGLAGEDQNFDGNGPYVRFQTGGGDQTLSTGTGGSLSESLFSNVSSPPIGTRPAYPGKRPPYNSTAKCADQKIPDLNGAKTGRADGGAGGSASSRASVRVAPTTAEKQAAAKQTAVTKAAKGDSLTDELVSRLNPFAAGAGK